MTTIAARRNGGHWSLACDSQETIEGTDSGDIKLPCQKLFSYNGGVVATAGDSAMGMRFVNHMRKQGGFKPDPDREFACLVLDRNGSRLTLWDEDMEPQEITLPFYAIGTGRLCAFAAMEAGADVRRAVEIAAKYDPYTGGEIVVVP